MNIVVRRVYDGMTDRHTMSVVADGSNVRYVLPNGQTDAVLSPERPALFVPVFKEVYGREPQSSDDWAECASFNLGLVWVGEPVEYRYEALPMVVREEQDLLDKSEASASEPKIRPDSEVPVVDLYAVAGESGDVIALLLLEGASGKEQWRVEGGWSDTRPDGINDDTLEDLTLIKVSPEYLAAYDGGSRSASDTESYLVTAEEQ